MGYSAYSSDLDNSEQQSFLVDNYGRQIDYLRIAVTDRCNLRCTYCMPEEGIALLSHENVLKYEELDRLVNIFIRLGIKKVRITGGEPFVRAGLIPFLQQLAKKDGLESLHITTNGVVTYNYLSELKELGIAGINFSLDTLDPERFIKFTRRDFFSNVKRSIDEALALAIPVKVNTVVQHANADEITELAALAKHNPLQVRFIEQMPFGGCTGLVEDPITVDDIFSILRERYPQIERDAFSGVTATKYCIPGFQGSIGIISGYSRTFCSFCSRIRITPEGELKTCLYDDGVFSLREALRCGATDSNIVQMIQQAVQQRHFSGREAEMDSTNCRSMAAIGG